MIGQSIGFIHRHVTACFWRPSLAPRLTFFIGAAIVPNMANEIWAQLQDGTLSYAANLTDEMQLAGICRWLVRL